MFYRKIKRMEDILFSLSILIIFSPILILISFISLITNGWPIFYLSKRMVGINNEIMLIKFRTMVKDAKSEKYGLEKKYMTKGYLDIPLDSEVYTGSANKNKYTVVKMITLIEIVKIITVPPIRVSVLGCSFITNQTHKGPKIVSNKKKRLTSKVLFIE